jgi:hypothetical protein
VPLLPLHRGRRERAAPSHRGCYEVFVTLADGGVHTNFDLR